MHQNTVESSTYGSELVVMSYEDEACKSYGIAQQTSYDVDGCGKVLKTIRRQQLCDSVIVNAQLFKLEKKCNSIAFHKATGAVAAGFVK